MLESLLEELKRYVGFNEADEQALRGLHVFAAPEFERISSVFYRRILDHEGARKALEGGESQIGKLKVTLVAWLSARAPLGLALVKRILERHGGSIGYFPAPSGGARFVVQLPTAP
jgi:hypothetical protein